MNLTNTIKIIGCNEVIFSSADTFWLGVMLGSISIAVLTIILLFGRIRGE